MLGRPGISWKALLAVSLTASVFPCLAEAGPWSVGAGGGWTSAYRPHPPSPFESSRSRYTSTWLVNVSVARAMTPSLQLRSEVSAFAHEAERETFFGLYRAGRNPGTHSEAMAAYGQAREQTRAEIMPLAIGVRVHGTFGRSGISPYLELLPTLFLVRWNEHVSGTAYHYPDSTSQFSAHRELTRGVPGATLGLGFNIRGGDSWNVDYGIQYRLSGQVASESSPAPEFSQGPLMPIATLALAVSVTWSPP